MPPARPRLSDLPPSALLVLAAEYRAMAETARTVEVRDALLRVADRLERRAADNERLGSLAGGQGAEDAAGMTRPSD